MKIIPHHQQSLTGCLTLDTGTFVTQKLERPEQQPRAMKSNIKNHVLNNQNHRQKVEEKLRKQKKNLDKDTMKIIQNLLNKTKVDEIYLGRINKDGRLISKLSRFPFFDVLDAISVEKKPIKGLRFCSHIAIS